MKLQAIDPRENPQSKSRSESPPNIEQTSSMLRRQKSTVFCGSPHHTGDIPSPLGLTNGSDNQIKSVPAEIPYPNTVSSGKPLSIVTPGIFAPNGPGPLPELEPRSPLSCDCRVSLG